MVYQIETTSPPGPADLDLLTPYGTLFRYEDIPAEVGLDRKAAFEIITTLRELVEQKLGVR
jgi:hypothetical protein